MLFHRKNIDNLKIYNLQETIKKSFYDQLESQKGYTALFFQASSLSHLSYLISNTVSIFPKKLFVPFFLENNDVLDDITIKHSSQHSIKLTNDLNSDNILDTLISLSDFSHNRMVHLVSSNEYLHKIHKFYSELNFDNPHDLINSLISNGIISKQQIEKHSNLLREENFENNSLKILFYPSYLVGACKFTMKFSLQSKPHLSFENINLQSRDILKVSLEPLSIDIPVYHELSNINLTLTDDQYDIFSHHLSEILKHNKKLKGYYFEYLIPSNENFNPSFFKTIQSVFSNHPELLKDFISKNLAISSNLHNYTKELYNHPDLFKLFLDNFILNEKTIKEGKQEKEIFQILNQVIPKSDLHKFPELLEKFPSLNTTFDEAFSSLEGESQFSYLLSMNFNQIFTTIYPNQSYLTQASLLTLVKDIMKDFFTLDNKNTDVYFHSSNVKGDFNNIKMYFTSNKLEDLDEIYIKNIFKKIISTTELINIRKEEDKDKFVREIYLSHQLNCMPKDNIVIPKKKI